MDFSTALPNHNLDPETQVREPAAKFPNFAKELAQRNVSLTRASLTTVQLNLGKLCNQTCTHCHVDAGPTKKRENMDSKTVSRILELLRNTPNLKTLDLTGGAPELNPNFRFIVKEARSLGLEVIDRCNLTVLFESGQEDLADFLADQGARVVASLPCYTEGTVDLQRGNGVFAKSIKGLRLLNSKGYGVANSGLKLDLVYNPSGGFLPPSQVALELDYKARLHRDFGVEFSNLFALANLPVKRFAAYLKQKGELESYYALILENFNPASVENLMCRSLVSVSWEGKLFDCDFNQMENLPISNGGQAKDIWTIGDFRELNTHIKTASHCFGCTAGQGSSCQGAVSI